MKKNLSGFRLDYIYISLILILYCSLTSDGAPLQETTELEHFNGCYYNYNHYNEGDRILTNEPCLNCTCHDKMLMCYLRVCPFTKPIGHDCVIEKREDQCCPAIICPDVPVELLSHQGSNNSLSTIERYGCTIDNRFYPEGAQIPSNPHKPCELCYCIKNRTSCIMQECTLHVDGCQPIYNRGSCCPIRYNCDNELEYESTVTELTTTIRPTPGFVLSTISPMDEKNCLHNGNLYGDGELLPNDKPCEHCYCMRSKIVCAVRECNKFVPTEGRNCTMSPPKEDECCPSSYSCDKEDQITVVYDMKIDESTTPINEIIDFTTISSDIFKTTTTNINFDENLNKILPDTISEEDVQLQEHIDDVTQLTNRINPETSTGESTTLTTIKPIIPTKEETSTLTNIFDKIDQLADLYTSTELPKEVDSLNEEISTVQPIKFNKEQFTTITPHIDTAITEDIPKEDISIEDISKEDISNEDISTEDIFKEDSVKEDISAGDISTEDISKEDSPKEESPKEDISEEDENAIKSTTEGFVSTLGSSEPTTTSFDSLDNEILNFRKEIVPLSIPGEGDCLVDGITYLNNSNVPPVSKCYSSCLCVSSSVKCDHIRCMEPLDSSCIIDDKAEDECCTTYICEKLDDTMEITNEEEIVQIHSTPIPFNNVHLNIDETTTSSYDTKTELNLIKTGIVNDIVADLNIPELDFQNTTPSIIEKTTKTTDLEWNTDRTIDVQDLVTEKVSDLGSDTGSRVTEESTISTVTIGLDKSFRTTETPYVEEQNTEHWTHKETVQEPFKHTESSTPSEIEKLPESNTEDLALIPTTDGYNKEKDENIQKEYTTSWEHTTTEGIPHSHDVIPLDEITTSASKENIDHSQYTTEYIDTSSTTQENLLVKDEINNETFDSGTEKIPETRLNEEKIEPQPDLIDDINSIFNILPTEEPQLELTDATHSIFNLLATEEMPTNPPIISEDKEESSSNIENRIQQIELTTIASLLEEKVSTPVILSKDEEHQQEDTIFKTTTYKTEDKIIDEQITTENALKPVILTSEQKPQETTVNPLIISPEEKESVVESTTKVPETEEEKQENLEAITDKYLEDSTPAVIIAENQFTEKPMAVETGGITMPTIHTDEDIEKSTDHAVIDNRYGEYSTSSNIMSSWSTEPTVNLHETTIKLKQNEDFTEPIPVHMITEANLIEKEDQQIHTSTIIPIREHEQMDASTTIPVKEDEQIDTSTTIPIKEHEQVDTSTIIPIKEHEQVDTSTTIPVKEFEDIDSSTTIPIKEHGQIDTSTTIPIKEHEQVDTSTIIPIKEHEQVDTSTIIPIKEHEQVDTSTTIPVKEDEYIDSSTNIPIKERLEVDTSTIIPIKEHEEIDTSTTIPIKEHEQVDTSTIIPIKEHEQVDTSTIIPIKEHEQVDTSTIIPIKEHEQVDTSTTIPVKEHEQIDTSTIIPIKEHEQVDTSTTIPIKEQEQVDTSTIIPIKEHEQVDTSTTIPIKEHEQVDTSTIIPIKEHEQVDTSTTIPVKEDEQTHTSTSIPIDENKIEEVHTDKPVKEPILTFTEIESSSSYTTVMPVDLSDSKLNELESIFIDSDNVEEVSSTVTNTPFPITPNFTIAPPSQYEDRTTSEKTYTEDEHIKIGDISENTESSTRFTENMFEALNEFLENQTISQGELLNHMTEENVPLKTTITANASYDKTTESTIKPVNETKPIQTDKQQSYYTTESPQQQSGYGQIPHYPSYAEDDYSEEEESGVFSPGTCRYGGKLFVSAQQIPRDDPCDFCFCFRSDIICLQQSCPPPISGCHEEPIQGFCCPRYECPVSMAINANNMSTTTTTLPPHLIHLSHADTFTTKTGCQIQGQAFKVGEKIDSASGPCMHCTCGGDGQMKCEPKACTPEPMLRQMIAVVTSRRR